MKLNLHKLKYNIWLYFILFALGVMCLVCFIQLVFTERYFLNEVSSQLETTAAQVGEQYKKLMEYPDNEEFQEQFIYTANRAKEIDDICVIFTTEGYHGDPNEKIPDQCYPADDRLMTYYDEYGSVIKDLKLATKDEGGEYCGQWEGKENDTGKLYVYVKIISDQTAEDPVYLILISSLKNVTSMISLIQGQLAIVSVVVIVIAFFISLLIASNLSSPLVNMTKTAKRLAHGDFSVKFTASGYSEISELSDTLNYMKEELKKTSVLQRELLANVTHDLKTPLTMVKAYAEMIKDISGENKEKRDKHAQVIIDEADRLTMLVNDILNLSKVQSNVDELDVEVVNLSQLTNKVIDHFSSFSEKSGYIINAKVSEGIYAEFDSKKIEQVIYNLIGNAINYTGENKTVEVFLTEENGKALFEVIDSGKGIDEEKIDTIWEKYYRASETHKRPVKGTGLGLSIVKAVLEAHGLKYGVISKRNVGSNFFVEFPVCAKEVVK